MTFSLSSLRGRLAVAGAAVMAAALPVLSFAQAVADPFDAAISATTTKVTSYAGALVTLSAVAVVFMIAIKYVKKIPKAS